MYTQLPENRRNNSSCHFIHQPPRSIRSRARHLFGQFAVSSFSPTFFHTIRLILSPSHTTNTLSHLSTANSAKCAGYRVTMIHSYTGHHVATYTIRKCIRVARYNLLPLRLKREENPKNKNARGGLVPQNLQDSHSYITAYTLHLSTPFGIGFSFTLTLTLARTHTHEFLRPVLERIK